jgi:hypothetical protein
MRFKFFTPTVHFLIQSIDQKTEMCVEDTEKKRTLLRKPLLVSTHFVLSLNAALDEEILITENQNTIIRFQKGKMFSFY